MSRVADLLIDVVDKVLEKLNVPEVDDDTWGYIQDWVMEFAGTQDKVKTMDVNFLADEFIKVNVCAKCKSIFKRCNCEG